MNNEDFHAVLVNKSLKDLSILNKFKIIGQKIDGSWTLYKIAVESNNLEKAIKELQINMSEGSWYFHFYNQDGSKLIIIYRDKVFETDNNPNNWLDAINYGTSLGIPVEQLDFVPNIFKNETY